MKKLITLFVLFELSLTPVFASGVVAGATFPQQIVDMVQQTVQNNSGAITAAGEYYQKYKSEIIDPIANALIASAQRAVANELISWANGGFKGTPSFISNPDKFIKNRGLQAVKGATISININDPYANSILNGVIRSYRSNESVDQQLADLAVSQVPVLLQDNVCKDETLNRLARDQVRNRDGTTNYDAMIVQKTQLYNKLCRGNPLRDPRLARTLNQIAQANPSLTGLDGILVTSSGDNPYYVQTKSIEAVRLQEAQARANAQNEQNQGGGMVAQRKCVKENIDQTTNTKTCIEYEQTAASGLVKDATAKAQGAGLDRLSNIQGSGALSNFLTGFATIIITQAMKSAISNSNEPTTQLRSPAGYTDITYNPLSTATTSRDFNQSASFSSSTVYRQDLLTEPKTRQMLLEPLFKEIKGYKKMLNDLDTLDITFLSEFKSYEDAVVNASNVCMSAYIAITGTSTPGFVIEDANYQKASTTIANRLDLITTKRQSLLSERDGIQAAYKLINTASTTLNASYSSEEISDIFKQYSDFRDNNGYPTFESLASRKGEYLQTKEDARAAHSSGGELVGAQTACQNLINTTSNGGTVNYSNPRNIATPNFKPKPKQPKPY